MSFVTLMLVALAGYNSYLVVSTDQLAGMQDVVVVDTRSAEAYAAGHIPGAVHFDPESLSEDEPIPGLMKPPHRVVAALEQAGIDPDKRVVVYAGMADGSDFKRATRLFWFLEYLQYPQVSYLDGGLAAWKRENRAVSTEATVLPAVKLNTLYITPDEDRLATHKEVVEFVQDPEAQDHAPGVLVDMRPPAYYAGLEKKDFISVAGPIPGAVNLPAADLLDSETHLLKDKAGLTDLVRVENLLGTNVGREEEMLQPLDENTPIITYCNTGRDATTGYFLFRLLGYHKVEMFDGSMAEWSLVTEKTASSQR